MRKFFAGRIALIIFGGVLVAGAEAARHQAAHGNQAEQSFADLADILEQVGRRPNGFRGGKDKVIQPCDTSASPDTCSIHVNIIQTYDASSAGAPFGCILRVDDVSVAAGVKHIKWSLYLLPSASAPDSAATPVSTSTVPPYVFYPKYEVLVVEKDDAAQVGIAVPNVDGSVSVPYSYKKKGQHIKYYPVVAQNLKKDNELLCGSLDPKIVNN